MLRASLLGDRKPQLFTGSGEATDPQVVLLPPARCFPPSLSLLSSPSSSSLLRFPVPFPSANHVSSPCVILSF